MAHISNNGKVVIKGSNTFNAIIRTGDSIHEGIKILCNHAAPGALHNSGERFDPPNCHPGTRIAVLEEIMSWIDDPKSNFPVMWMNGAMGGGKSSIAQALAELYYQKQQLLGSFFFSRTSPTRNNEKRVVATLAYHMAKEMPQIRPYVSAAILEDPLIFESSLEAQIEALIIGPHFRSAHFNGSAQIKARLIIIDGLDECVNRDAQGVIVKAFVSSIVAHGNTPPFSFKILIASRPEINIDTAFRAFSTSVKRLSLDEQWLPDHDIKRFLTDGFENLRSTHRIGRRLLAHWPSVSDIDQLVQRSSGQFIYASVVIKFLQSAENGPIRSLKVILGLSKDVLTNNRPYAALDAFYEHIFSEVKDLHLVLRIMCLRLTKNHPRDHKIAFNLIESGSTVSMIKDILGLSEEMLMVALTSLVSVLKYDPDVDRGDMIFYHASFSEFLQDKERSGRLYVNSEEICADLACRCVPFNKNSELEGSHKWRLLVFQLMYDFLSPEMRSSLCDALSSMNIMSALENTCQSLNFCEDVMDLAIDYIRWFFAKYASNSTTNLPNSLENAVKLCSQYILRHVKALPLNGFDQTDTVDIWIFAMSGVSTSTGMFSMQRIAEIMTYLTDSNRSRFANGEESPSAKFCWKILPYVPLNIRSNVQLFGKHALTGDRYIYAALCIFEAIAKMNVQHMDSTLGHNPMDIGDSLQYISDLFSRTPASKDLYKVLQEALVEHTSEPFSKEDSLQARSYLRHGWDCFEVALIFSCYMLRTGNEIPNIDSIIQEEREDALRTKIQTRPREFFRGKKSKLIMRLKGGGVTP